MSSILSLFGIQLNFPRHRTSRALQFARATHSPQTTHVELQDTRVDLPSRSTTRTSETFDNDRRERDDGDILPAVPGVKPSGHSIA